MTPDLWIPKKPALILPGMKDFDKEYEASRRYISLRKKGGPPVPLSLTYKGHGYVLGDPYNTNAKTLHYETVSGGSAPAAGDLVCWIGGTFSDDRSGGANQMYRVDPGGGWAVGAAPALLVSTGTNNSWSICIFAKVVDASDITSPLSWWATTGSYAGIEDVGAFWIAYTVTGIITSISVPVCVKSYNGLSAPTSISIDSSALNPPSVAITLFQSVGTDGAIQLTGITPDKELTTPSWAGYFTNTGEARMGAKMDVGGAAYTLGKGDDGAINGIHGGYVSVS